ncbi:hypothetical protein SNEBB_002629 [Seison nebaliae]|nr:hypothetical protein SNEBB_002629 [Seison nebaliae]
MSSCNLVVASTLEELKSRVKKIDGEDNRIIATHNGKFHCDDVLACAMLLSLNKYKNSSILRTRDKSELDQCDIVVDVGDEYDVSRRRFDHHQKSFNLSVENVMPMRRSIHSNGIKLSSAGLIYLTYGKEILQSIISKGNPRYVIEDHSFVVEKNLMEKLFDKIYLNFMVEVDAIDNGINIGDNQKYDISTNLSKRIGRMNVQWNEKGDDNLFFYKAIDEVTKEFSDVVHFYAFSWLPAATEVEESFKNRFTVDKSGEIMLLKKVCPWQSHLLMLEEAKTDNSLASIKYVIYEAKENDWRIQAAPISADSFTSRLPLPENWRGRRTEELAGIIGLDNANFVHSSGFIGGAKSKETVIRMGQLALDADKSTEHSEKKLKLDTAK